MRLRWVFLLLLVLNAAYLGAGLYRAQVMDPERGNPPLQRAPGVGEIRLIDSLVDSPPPSELHDPDPAPTAVSNPPFANPSPDS